MEDVCDWPGLVSRAGSPRRARTLVASGEWRRVVQGAYAPWWLVDGPEVRAAALRKVLPPDAALSHRSALWALGLDLLDGDRLDVTVPRDRRLVGRPGLRVHTARLADEELCLVGGLLVVSAARAVVDVLRSEPLVEAVAVTDAVLRSGAARLGTVDEVLDRSRGLRGVRQARRALAHVDARSESLMESRLRTALVLGGLEGVESQVDLYDDSGHAGRIDLVVQGVLCEYDGREPHLLEAAFVRERRRQSRLLEAGAELRRFTAADVYRRSPQDLAHEVLRAARLVQARPPVRLRRGPDTLRPPARRPLPTLAEQREGRAA